MTDAEWKGLATSIALHVLLLAIGPFLTLTAPPPEDRPPPPVAIELFEIEFGPVPGPMAVAAPPARAPRPAPERARPGVEREVRPPTLGRASGARPTPVPTPRPQPPVVTPTSAPPEAETEEIPVPPEGPPAGSAATGDETGGLASGSDTGRGSVEGREGGTGGGTTGFDIGGLGDRSKLSGPLPSNPGVRGRGVYRITVAPDGSVVSVSPQRRAGGQADDRALRALRAWRFNRLPADAGNQSGTITFNFTLG